MAAAVAVDPATAMAPTAAAVSGRGTTDPDTLFARLSTTSVDEEMARTLTGDVESLQRTADRQMTKLTTLNSSLNKKLRKLEADAAHLGGENANLRRAYINLLAELRAAQAAAAELAAKEAELATATSNYDGARRTVKELKARLKRNIADGKAVQAEKAAVEAQLADVNAANEVKTREAGEELMAAAAARTVLERDLEAAKAEATDRSAALETTAEARRTGWRLMRPTRAPGPWSPSRRRGRPFRRPRWVSHPRRRVPLERPRLIRTAVWRCRGRSRNACFHPVAAAIVPAAAAAQ